MNGQEMRTKMLKSAKLVAKIISDKITNKITTETLHLGASAVGRSPGSDDGRPEKGEKNMLEIKVNKIDGVYFFTKINATLEEVAEYYFPREEVESVEILDGGNDVNEFRTVRPLEIFRADPAEIEKFQLAYNIRLKYAVLWVDSLPSGVSKIVSSCGLASV